MIAWSDDKPKLIVLDGVDGSGKTSIAKGLVQRINQEGLTTHYVASLGETGIAKTVRERLYDGSALSPDTLAVYMAAAMTDTYLSTILPLLQQGDYVVVDRWLPSYYVYQCRYGGTQISQILYQSHLTRILPDPTYYFYITASAEVCEKRLAQRESLSRYDTLDDYDKHFIHRIYESYYFEYIEERDCDGYSYCIDTTHAAVNETVRDIYDILCTPTG